MADLGNYDLTGLLNLNNLLYVSVFIGSLSTAYWRLRKYLANKNKEYMREVAEDVKKTIIENVVNDNIVTEINFKEKMDADAKVIKNEMDKRFETVNSCTHRIEEKLNQHDEKLTNLNTKVEVHVAKADERAKSLDRVIDVVNGALGIVKPVVEHSTQTIQPMGTTETTTTTREQHATEQK